MGLYLVLTEQKNPRKAYDVAKKISQYFPAPGRLADVLRLAVETANYDDIEKYYSIFINIDDRNEVLIRHVCAALVVCGKYYLRTKPGQARSLELFKKAAVTAQGRTKILREIVFALLDFELTNEAQRFLLRFPPESFETDEYLISKFLVNAAVETTNQSAIVGQGRALLGRGIVDERVFLALIRKAVAAKISVMGIEDIMNRASTAFPDKKAHFETTLQKARQAAEH